MTVEDISAENRKCTHKWIDMDDGTKRKFCVRCAEFAIARVAIPTQMSNSAQEIKVNINIKPPSVEDIAKKINEEISRSARMKGVSY